MHAQNTELCVHTVDARNYLRPMTAAIECDPEIIRAAWSTDILGRLGAQLRKPKGDPSTYALSHATMQIDGFISHSWRHSGFRKFLALCYYYNNLSAICVALLTTVMVAGLRLQRGPPMPLAAFPSICAGDPPRLKGVELITTYLLTYLITLLFGHSFLPGSVLRPRRWFHDKNCIHPTDPAKFAEGVRQLHTFLACSANCIVLYNNDYLERLWCVYELAAYTSRELRADGSNLIFLSPLKAPAIIMMTCVVSSWHLIEYISLVAAPGARESSAGPVVVMPVPVAPFCMALLFGGLGYTILASGRERATVLRRLDAFTVAAGKVFSEQDRGYIEDKICSWYSNEGERARGHWLSAIAEQLTSSSRSVGSESGSPRAGKGAGSTLFATTALRASRKRELIARFEAEVHRGGRIYRAVERMVGRHRSGLCAIDVCTFLMPNWVGIFEYIFDNPMGSNGLVTFTVASFCLAVPPVLLASMLLPMHAWLSPRCGNRLASAVLLPFAIVAGTLVFMGTAMPTFAAFCTRYGTLP